MKRKEKINMVKELIKVGYTDTEIIEEMEISRRSFYYYKNEITTHRSKILLFDIETAPMLSYHWGRWKQNIPDSMRLDNRVYMISFSAKWLGSDKIIYAESRTEDDSKLVKKLLKLLDKADIVITHNGDKFDIKKVNTFAIINNLKVPSPYRSIDTLKLAKKHFSFERNSLKYIADILGCSPKQDHAKFQGFELWKQCIAGNDDAFAEMEKYNKQDVVTLEEVYLKLRGWSITQNVAFSLDTLVCPTCGSSKLKENGVHLSNTGMGYSKYKCTDCSSYSRKSLSSGNNEKLTQC